MVDRVFKLSTGYPYGGRYRIFKPPIGDGDKYLDEILGGEWGKGDRGLCTKFKRLVTQ